MKITLRIARNELASLFFSPVAWFILIVFSFLCAKYYCNMVDSLMSYYGIYGNGGGSVTESLFMASTSVWNDIVRSLYIYIPLLTMGLVSRELSSGSIKLLYSSPVTSLQIVAGKYLAAIVFGSCLLIVPVLEVLVSGVIYVPHFDWAPVLVGLLGVFLLMCVYCSIGLFMSSLTSYQVVAAIGTLAVLAVFRFVGQIGQEYDFVRELTYWLSINGRTDQFVGGVLRSEDVVYFIAVIGMFLAFTTLRIWFSRKSAGRVSRMLAYTAVVAVTLIIGYATSRPQTVAVWDATRNKSNSLTAYSQELLRDIKGPLTITSYVNLLDNMSGSYMPRNIKTNEYLFAPYRLAKPDLYERYVYYYDETPGNSLARRPRFMDMSLEEMRDYMVLIQDVNPYLFLTPDEIRRVEDLSGENNQFVRIVETADGRRAYLRDFSDMVRTPGEAEISAVLKKMVADVPLVAFINTAGSREISRPGDRDYGAFSIEKYSRAALVNQGFDVCEINLDAGESIPDSVSIIVLGDPRREMTEGAMAAIGRYLDRGGNMFMLTDTGRQDNVNKLLERFGIKALDGQLAQITDDFSADFILAGCAEPAEGMPRSFAERFGGRDLRVTMPGCVALDTLADGRGYSRTVWLQTPSEGSWIELESRNLSDDMDISCNKDAGETERSYPTLIAAERMLAAGKMQRILVAGDADCMSNAELQIGREGFKSGNFDLVVEGFRYLSGGEFPIDVRREPNTDTAFSAGAASLSGVVNIVLMIVLPVLMILLGVGLQLLRGKK